MGRAATSGAAALGKALEEIEGAVGLVFAGKMSDRIFDLASKAGIDNVLASTVGDTARKGASQRTHPQTCDRRSA